MKALYRRGFVAEVTDRAMATNGRVLFAVPEELGGLLTTLFREETRTVASFFSLAAHLSAITAAEKDALRRTFPRLGKTAGPGDVGAILGDGTGLLERVEPPLRDVVLNVIEVHGGFVSRQDWSQRQRLTDVPWQREAWSAALEGTGKKGKVLAAVFDEEEGTLKGIQGGTIAATVVQHPYEMGYRSARWMHLLATDFEKAKAEIPPGGIENTGVEVIDKDNLADFEKRLAGWKK